ncbi:MAG: DNA polymerase Y family protein, partial [Pseudomonadota bacterium]
MSRRRILSIWFPRLAAERILRTELRSLAQPFAVVEDQNNMQVILSLCPAASAEGLRRGQPLRDAQAMCPNLITRLAHPQADAAFLTVLQRWAVKFSPWVAEDGRDGLIIDLTGCAHLFGGEETLLQRLEDDCTGLGLSIQAGIADTVGAAWALARYAGHSAGAVRSGDAID